MKFMKKQIKKDIKYNLISGKTFNIEIELSTYEVYDGSKKGNVACYNFCIRRGDFFPGFKKKIILRAYRIFRICYLLRRIRKGN